MLAAWPERVRLSRNSAFAAIGAVAIIALLSHAEGVIALYLFGAGVIVGGAVRLLQPVRRY